jgi:hypothetical protein
MEYWCVNFGYQEPLDHGIEKKCWMMQYQYADDEGNEHEGDRPGVIGKNWRRLALVKPGHKFVAYLRGNRFFAIGTVIKPRRPSSEKEHGDIEKYLQRKRSHDRTTGFVYYTPVFYEDFSDRWRAKEDNSTRWPQRIDVEGWRSYVHEGVVVKGMRKRYRVSRPETRLAVFKIPKEMFDEINAKLAAKLR